MSRPLSFIQSPLGKKILMALSGLALVGFLVTHLAGNLLIFKGADAYNAYSHLLITNPFIVIAELILVAFFLGHAINGISIVMKNRRARGNQNYTLKRRAGHTSRKSLSSTTMILSGLVILIFVPLHLATFKYGPHYTSASDPAMRDIYRLVIEEFREPEEVIWYTLAMLVLGFHLYHAAASAIESLGFRHRKIVHCLSHGLAILIAAGFAAFPLMIYFLGDHL